MLKDILFILNGEEGYAFNAEKALPCQGKLSVTIPQEETLREYIDYICKNHSVGGNPPLNILYCDERMKKMALSYAKQSTRSLALFSIEYLLPKLSENLLPNPEDRVILQLFEAVWEIDLNNIKKVELEESVKKITPAELADAFFTNKAMPGKEHLEMPASSNFRNDLVRFIASSRINSKSGGK